MRQNGSDRYFFFHFLVIVEIKGEKGSLAHDKTLFGRRVPFFTFLVGLGINSQKKLGTCQNLAWKAFLLFGDLC